MSDQRRNHRPDSRQIWDESDHRDRERHHNRDRDRGRERRNYRSRSREGRGGGGRSRSPEARSRDFGHDRGRPGRSRGDGRDRNPDHSRRHDNDRDRRDRRRDDGRDSRGPAYDSHRRSASPKDAAQSASLPTRSRQNPNSPIHSSSRKPRRRSPSPLQTQRKDGLSRDKRASDAPMDDDNQEIDDDDDEAAMKAMMGFSGFGSTKNKKVAGNDVGGVRKEKKTEYRQYMNRQGGFNRPLSPSR